MGNFTSKDLDKNELKQYGWKRELPDCRDYLKFADNFTANYAEQIDLRDKSFAIYEQKQIGSSASNAIAAAYEFAMLQKDINFSPSRLFIYYNQRKENNKLIADIGGDIRSGLKSITKYGVCDEKIWPTNIENINLQPSIECYTMAQENKYIKYQRIRQTANQIKTTLSLNIPIIVGISIYESFNNNQNGHIEMPKHTEKLLGGHCVLLVGYNENKEWIFRNSWGSEWGDNGYGYLPYEYLIPKNYLADDFWVLTIEPTPETITPDTEMTIIDII